MGQASEAALRLLDAWFGAAGPAGAPSRAGGSGTVGTSKRVGESGGSGAVPLWSHQAEGLARVRSVVEGRGGAILADSVGLGKTRVALGLLAEHLESGGEGVVVVPASLRPFWRRKLRPLGPTTSPRGGTTARLRLLSHTQLARGVSVAPPAGARLVIVDEAHRFRNPRTLRYAALARLTASSHARTLLVTATPVNNGVDDLLHLLRLFAPDDAFRDLGVASLAGAFEAAGARTARATGGDRTAPASRAGEEGAPMTRIIRAVVVRRTRAMVRARFGESAAFPRRAVPRIVPYADPDIADRARLIAELELPLYGAGSGGRPRRGTTLRSGAGRRRNGSEPVLDGPASASPLVKLGLLKRLDSSRAAFERSAARLRSQTGLAAEAVAAGRLPDLEAGRSVADPGEDPLQLVLVGIVSRPAPPGADLSALAGALARDLDRLDRLARPGAVGLGDGGAGAACDAADPKLEALVRLLEATPGERTLVFTEYRDTAEALWRGLVDRFRAGRIDGSGAWLGRRVAGRRVVVERFAPRANGRRRVPAREGVDVLVATDVLAEGLNLQDARQVVSYDLPWNPVRLLQRIGRIDRAGSPHDEIVPFLFAPATGLDGYLGLTRRLETKLWGIAATVGAEHVDALLGGLAGWDDARDPGGSGVPAPRVGGVLNGIEAAEDRDPVERLRTLWVRHRSGLDPATGRDTSPHGTEPVWATVYVGAERRAADLEWVVGVRQVRDSVPADGARPTGGAASGRVVLLEVNRGPIVRRVGRRAADAFAVALAPGDPPSEARRGVPDDFPWREVRQFVRDLAAAGAAPALVHRGDPAARLATRLRRALSAEAGLDRELLAEADFVLSALAAPLPPGATRALDNVLDRAERLGPLAPTRPAGSGSTRTGEEARTLIEAARSVLMSCRDRAGPGRSAMGRIGIEVLGALRIVTDPGPDRRASSGPADEPAIAVDAS